MQNLGQGHGNSYEADIEQSLAEYVHAETQLVAKQHQDHLEYLWKKAIAKLARWRHPAPTE